MRIKWSIGQLRKTGRCLDHIRVWFQRLETIYKIALVIVAVAVFLGLWSDDEENIVTLDFNTIASCNRGSLAQMKRDTTLPGNLLLSEGAADLFICDNEALMAKKPDFPKALSKKYPGCLRLDESKNALHMLLNPSAVCKIHSERGTRYHCNGADRAARIAPDQNALVSDTSRLGKCNGSIFR